MEYGERTSIVVVEFQQKEGVTSIGIVVDSVSEVLNISGEDIEDAPAFGSGTVDTNYILGMAKSDDGVKLLLDIDKVLTVDELAVLEKTGYQKQDNKNRKRRKNYET